MELTKDRFSAALEARIGAKLTEMMSAKLGRKVRVYRPGQNDPIPQNMIGTAIIPLIDGTVAFAIVPDDVEAAVQANNDPGDSCDCGICTGAFLGMTHEEMSDTVRAHVKDTAETLGKRIFSLGREPLANDEDGVARLMDILTGKVGWNESPFKAAGFTFGKPYEPPAEETAPAVTPATESEISDDEIWTLLSGSYANTFGAKVDKVGHIRNKVNVSAPIWAAAHAIRMAFALGKAASTTRDEDDAEGDFITRGELVDAIRKVATDPLSESDESLQQLADEIEALP